MTAQITLLMGDTMKDNLFAICFRRLLPVIALLLTFACSSERQRPASEPDAAATDAPPPAIETVLQQNSAELMQIPGVVGVAQGLQDERPCIVVYVKEKTDAVSAQIPKTLNGYPVQIIESGELRALPKPGL